VVVRKFNSEAEPDGVLLTGYGNRRASVCPVRMTRLPAGPIITRFG
jgi:hypothetical protein